MFYLIMRETKLTAPRFSSGRAIWREWWNDENGSWGTRLAATQFSYPHPDVIGCIQGGRWVGPCDGTEE